MSIWQYQQAKNAKTKPEKGGGEKIAVEEENASISEVYAHMVERGVIGTAVSHASGGQVIDERRAYAMMKNAGKNPKYMEYTERQIKLKQLDKMVAELQELKGVENEEKQETD